MVAVSELKSRLDECWEMSRKGQSTEGLVFAQELLIAASRKKDRASEAFALTSRAWFCLQLGYAEEGLTPAIDARTIFSELGENWGLALSSAVYSWLLLELGLSDLAFEEARLALEVAERTDDTALRSFAMTCKGMTLIICREDRLAHPILEEALELAVKAGDDCTIALNFINIGFSLANQADAKEIVGSDDGSAVQMLRERSVDMTERGIVAARHYGDLWNLRTALCNNAEVLATMGEFEAANCYLVEWEALEGTVGLREEIHYLYTKGEFLTRVGRLNEAHDVCIKAAELAENSSHLDHKVNTLRRLSEVEAALGDYKASLVHYREYHAKYVKQMGDTIRLRALLSEMQLQNQRLQAQAVRFEAEAHQDVLTGLPNRRAFEAAFAKHENLLFSLAMLDLDHFKRVNDNYSHIVGDAVLTRTGAILSERNENFQVFRLGGEEFALIMPGVDVDAAVPLVDYIRQAIADSYWADLGAGLSVTASFGVVDSREHRGRNILAEADRRLYVAKNSGRNRVVGAEPVRPPSIQLRAGELSNTV